MVEREDVLEQGDLDGGVSGAAVVDLADPHDHFVEAVLRPGDLDALTGHAVPTRAIGLHLHRPERRGGRAEIPSRELHRNVRGARAVIVPRVADHAALDRDIREILRDDGFLLLVQRVRPGDLDLVDRLAPELLLEVGHLCIVGRVDRQRRFIVVVTDQPDSDFSGRRIDVDDALNMLQHLVDEVFDRGLLGPHHRKAELLTI